MAEATGAPWRYGEQMARQGKAEPETRVRTVAGASPAHDVRHDADLCLDCGLCCDGTLFGAIVVHIPERELVESLGLEVTEDPAGGLVAPQPCSAFLEGCCAIYAVGRPMTCGSYRCAVVTDYTAGRAGRDESLAVIERVRALARELEAAMGLPHGGHSMRALAGFLAEHQPWQAPERHERFLLAFDRFATLGQEQFGYVPRPDEELAWAAGARLAARRVAS